jgi:hypothetical protein
MKRSSVFLFLLFCAFASSSNLMAAEWNHYSDNTRGLFEVPRSSAVGGSDIVFEKNGSPQSNPGIIAFDSSSELSLAYSSYYQNTFSASVLSYTGNINQVSGFALSLSYLYNPGIRGTDNLELDNDNMPIWDPSRFQYSTESNIFFHAAYGHKFDVTPRFGVSFGAGLNAQRHSLPFGLYKGYGMGLDAGVALDFPRPGIRLTLACDNATSHYTRWSSTYSEKAYPHLYFGMGYKADIPYIYGHIKLHYKTLDMLSNEGANAIDLAIFLGKEDTTSVAEQNLNVPRDNPAVASLSSDPLAFILSGSIGFEYRIMDVFAIRVGHSIINAWAFGCGINLLKKKLSFDFAYLTHELAPTYQLSVTYRN